MAPLPQINNKAKQKTQLFPCSPVGLTEWQGSLQPALASMLMGLPISPFVCRPLLWGLLTALCLGLPSFCCWAPSERWVNLCPGNPAFPQLQCQPGSSDTAAEQTYPNGSQSLFVHGPSHWGMCDCVQSRLSASPSTSCQ